PKAARKLLRLLAWVVIACLFFTLSLFLAASLNSEVSQLRRQMNAAMYEAQDYLGQRESLLEHISRGVTWKLREPLVQWRQLSVPVPPHEQIF
ncbi:hypothetical protein M2C68_19335, partial [Pseudomonas sp. BAgro211]|nr:hypothetical protein [Pseudomonas sp. BAgro211]